MTIQLAVRVDDDVAAAMDALVADDRYPNRTEIVRAALATLLDAERRAEIGRRIAAGYERIPDSGEFTQLHRSAARRTLADLEPWDWSGDDGPAAG